MPRSTASDDEYEPSPGRRGGGGDVIQNMPYDEALELSQESEASSLADGKPSPKAYAGAKGSGDDDLVELYGDFLDPDSSDSSDSESDADDAATAGAGGEGGATKVLTDLGASVTTMAEGMFATVGAPDEPE